MLLISPEINVVWCRYHLKEAVLEGGIPFNMTHGMTSFEYFGKDPRLNKIFNNGMFSHSTITMKKFLENYKGFESLKSVVDVGGGIGASLNMIISKYPSIKGINFDLPHVIQDAPAYPGVYIDHCCFPNIFFKGKLEKFSTQDLDMLKNKENTITFNFLVTSKCIFLFLILNFFILISIHMIYLIYNKYK